VLVTAFDNQQQQGPVTSSSSAQSWHMSEKEVMTGR